MTMNTWTRFFADERGSILSAEAVLVGSIGIVGATAGLSAVSSSVNEELGEMALAFRSLNQSYTIPEIRSGHAWTAGSSYVQPPVEESRERLQKQLERDRRREERKHRSAEVSDEGWQLPLRGESNPL
jgi:hypothetical protein